MDNGGILYEKDKEGLEVHRISPDFHDLGQRYGLTILAGNPRRVGGPVPAGEKRLLRYYEFYSISHLLEGEWACHFPGADETRSIRPGQAIVMTPGTVHWFGGTGSGFVESFLLFTGPIADYLRETGVVSAGVFEMGTTPRLNKVLEWASDPSIASQTQANVALQQILIDLHNMNQLLHSEKEHPLLARLVEEIKCTPERWWTVAEMAAYCKVSQAYFRIIFRKYTGQSPKRYVDESKIRQASALLCSSPLTVQEVADRFGYRDPYHFSKRFKQIVGVSPDQYRHSFNRGNI